MYEYVVLEMSKRFTSCRDTLIAQGWQEWIRTLWFGEGTLNACIMRRPKDEPRMWSESELKKLLAHDKELFESILEDAQTEADMQTAWNKDLLKRNEALQAAIDEVVTISKQPRPHGAVHRLLWPLTTKKEDGNEPIQD